MCLAGHSVGPKTSLKAPGDRGLTDPTKIKQADAILARKETRSIHVLGRIVKSKVPYNSQWSFYLGKKSELIFS